MPWSVKLTPTESAALLMVAPLHQKANPQDLLREMSLDSIVEEYTRLMAKVAAVSA